MKKALLIIDLQNDYFPEGKFPLWNTEMTLNNILETIKICKEKNYPIIHIQHIADPSLGLAPFFIKDSEGVQIVSEILEAAPNAPIVTKAYADGFANTNLNEILENLDVEELLVCGMMTQNCVTHTSISNKKSKNYKTSILTDACTSVSEPIHLIGLAATLTQDISLISYKNI
ncbi:MAG: cysteine hydrolase family protein [Cetobacterium sp.]